MIVNILPNDARIVTALPLAFERALLVASGVWFVNLVNFMDGIDWITVAEVVPITIGLILTGALGALPPIGVLIALALLGGMLGFAPFNRPVATLFLGDVGSLSIGLLLGWLLALLAASGHVAAAVLLPLYYVADATITLLRRATAGERIWNAHRSHFYQRATTRGFSVMEIVSRVFAVNLVLVVSALATVLADSRMVDIAALALGTCLVGWLLTRFAQGKPGARF
jgi:UDP-N-acetylmuramyl pentapeptide phosphotransferase/UDP-N-acetylglucosamine-1-phosphate transferase